MKTFRKKIKKNKHNTKRNRKSIKVGGDAYGTVDGYNAFANTDTMGTRANIYPVKSSEQSMFTTTNIGLAVGGVVTLVVVVVFAIK